MWRRVQGCVDVATAAREPRGDLPCDVAPGISTAGYCDCTTGPVANQVPRHAQCGVTKQPCQVVCATPPPPSTLPSAFGDAVASAPADATGATGATAPPWWRKHMATVIVSAAVLMLLVVHHLTAPSRDKRDEFARLVRAQQRQVQFERSLE